MKERRLQTVRVAFEALAGVLITGAVQDDTYSWRCIAGLPADVTLESVWLDQQSQEVCCTFSHPSWSPVSPGCPIRNFTPEFVREFHPADVP